MIIASKHFPRIATGAVLVGGVDVRDMDPHALMDQIAFVFQNSRLFKTSILENVRAARPEATREQVLAALMAAQCGDILEKLPKGMDTVIGTEGTYLSGGEQQRVALARAILKDAPIVVLDEATAFSDPENEHLIQKAFERLMAGKTVIMVAHRLDKNNISIFVAIIMVCHFAVTSVIYLTSSTPLQRQQIPLYPQNN